ncbi:hypothetical protein SNEBB_005222 [Seison nebaliae]|nr:hypothetical protein SNEBB_005222 [Seison nebaliae]
MMRILNYLITSEELRITSSSSTKSIVNVFEKVEQRAKNVMAGINSIVPMWKLREAADKITNVVMNYTEAECKVREATNDDAWGPHGANLHELAQLTFSYENYNEVMGMLWKRLFHDKKNWRRIYKALMVLEYLVKNGSEKCVTSARQHLYDLRTLNNYTCRDENGRDQGINVRHRVKDLLTLIQDIDRLREERKKAKVTKDKYVGISSEQSVHSTPNYYPDNIDNYEYVDENKMSDDLSMKRSQSAFANNDPFSQNNGNQISSTFTEFRDKVKSIVNDSMDAPPSEIVTAADDEREESTSNYKGEDIFKETESNNYLSDQAFDENLPVNPSNDEDDAFSPTDYKSFGERLGRNILTSINEKFKDIGISKTIPTSFMENGRLTYDRMMKPYDIKLNGSAKENLSASTSCVDVEPLWLLKKNSKTRTEMDGMIKLNGNGYKHHMISTNDDENEEIIQSNNHCTSPDSSLNFDSPQKHIDIQQEFQRSRTFNDFRQPVRKVRPLSNERPNPQSSRKHSEKSENSKKINNNSNIAPEDEFSDFVAARIEKPDKVEPIIDFLGQDDVQQPPQKTNNLLIDDLLDLKSDNENKSPNLTEDFFQSNSPNQHISQPKQQNMVKPNNHHQQIDDLFSSMSLTSNKSDNKINFQENNSVQNNHSDITNQSSSIDDPKDMWSLFGNKININIDNISPHSKGIEKQISPSMQQIQQQRQKNSQNSFNVNSTLTPQKKP